MAKKIRHVQVRNEEILTRYGAFKLDDTGCILNRDEVKASDEQILAEPGFVDADLFPGSPTLKAPPPPPPPTAEGVVTQPPPQTPTGTSPEDQAYKEIIRKLIAAGAKTNSEGYLEMPLVLQAIAQAQMKPITGGKRKELQDAIRAEDAASKA